MIKEEQIEIPLSNTKMTLSLLGSLVFVGLGMWFLIKPPNISNPILGNPTTLFVIGLVCILFFGLAAISIFRKFLAKIAGLTISQQGITDNSSGVSVGMIPWVDIQEIRVSQVMNQQFLLLIVRNPQEYIDKVTNPFKRNAMKMNYKTYGSPISISSKVLDTDFAKLQQLLVEKLNKYNP